MDGTDWTALEELGVSWTPPHGTKGMAWTLTFRGSPEARLISPKGYPMGSPSHLPLALRLDRLECSLAYGGHVNSLTDQCYWKRMVVQAPGIHLVSWLEQHREAPQECRLD